MKLTISKKNGKLIKLPSFEEEITAYPLPLFVLQSISKKYKKAFEGDESEDEQVQALVEVMTEMFKFTDVENAEEIIPLMSLDDVVELFSQLSGAETAKKVQAVGLEQK